MDVLESDIYLVGVGLHGLRQLTLEAVDVLRGVRVACDFSGQAEGLREFCGRVVDSRGLYEGGDEDVYGHAAREVVATAKQEGPVAVTFDGSPMTFSSLAWQIVAEGAEEGLRVEAVAGVSSLDVLPIVLGFDPGDLGMQTLEATEMVQYGLALNPYLSTLLLQVGFFGRAPYRAAGARVEGAYARLVDHLLRYFPPDHPAVFVQSASEVSSGTVMLSTEVGRIDEVRDEIRPGMTLYLPRVRVPAVVEAKAYEG